MSRCQTPVVSQHRFRHGGNCSYRRALRLLRIHHHPSLRIHPCLRQKQNLSLSATNSWSVSSRRRLDKCVVFSLERKKGDSIDLKRTPRRLEYAKSASLELVTESESDMTSTDIEGAALVEFRIKFRADYGHQMKLVGSDRHFGSWAIAKTPSMKWSDGHIWTCVLKLPIRSIYEYKYVIVDSNGATVVRWQQGNNCVLAVSEHDTELIVEDNWEGVPGAKVSSKGIGISTKEEKLMDWAEEMRMSSSKASLSTSSQQVEALEKAKEETQLVRQESSRLKSELRMASMSRQAAERQVKELQQENRRLLSIMMEQQVSHRGVLEQALKIVSDPPNDPVLETKTGQSETELNKDDPVESGGNGNSPAAARRQKSPHSRKPRSQSSKRNRNRQSTRTAALSS